jgi:hypothetical protein
LLLLLAEYPLQNSATEPFLLPKCIYLQSTYRKYVMAAPDGRVNAVSEGIQESSKFQVLNMGGSISLRSVHAKFLCAEPDGRVVANRGQARSWEMFKVGRYDDGSISLQSCHGNYISIDESGDIRGTSISVTTSAKLFVKSCESQTTTACNASGVFDIDYSSNRCSTIDGGTMRMKCESTDASTCGMRLSSRSRVGAGRYAISMRGAPGTGTATNFYLYTFGRQNGRSRPWNEIDFEVLGKHVGSSSSLIWTNFFVGQGREFPQFIRVPFNASADFHEYAVDVTTSSITWSVDSVVYRTEDISGYQDMVTTISSTNFQVLLSLWGQSRSTGNWREMDYLENNLFPFPLHADFKDPRLR